MGPNATREYGNLLPYDGTVLVIDHPDLATSDLAERLIETIAWNQETARIFGKPKPFPRLTAWYGEVPYSYSGVTHPPASPPEPVERLRARAQELTGSTFNSVLLNLYRTGQDSVGWHADAEPGLGPVIASLSLGGTRRFQFRHRRTKETVTIELLSGRWVIMAGATQHHWLHQVPKTKRPVEARVNLTFRTMNHAAVREPRPDRSLPSRKRSSC